MTKAFIVGLLILMNTGLVSAHGEELFAQAEDIVKQKTPCNQLTDNQLEILGDYYMEQMHPGELHEVMDERMGGDGSENLRLAHIRMARAFYCGEHELMGGSIMNMMMGRQNTGKALGFGMMGSGMGYYGGWHWVALIYWTIIIFMAAFLAWLIINALKQKFLEAAPPISIQKRPYTKAQIIKRQHKKKRK